MAKDIKLKAAVMLEQRRRERERPCEYCLSLQRIFDDVPGYLYEALGENPIFGNPCAHTGDLRRTTLQLEYVEYRGGKTAVVARSMRELMELDYAV